MLRYKLSNTSVVYRRASKGYIGVSSSYTLWRRRGPHATQIATTQFGRHLHGDHHLYKMGMFLHDLDIDLRPVATKKRTCPIQKVKFFCILQPISDARKSLAEIMSQVLYGGVVKPEERLQHRRVSTVKPL